MPLNFPGKLCFTNIQRIWQFARSQHIHYHNRRNTNYWFLDLHDPGRACRSSSPNSHLPLPYGHLPFGAERFPRIQILPVRREQFILGTSSDNIHLHDRLLPRNGSGALRYCVWDVPPWNLKHRKFNFLARTLVLRLPHGEVFQQRC